jgi:hypothetical protein
MQGRPSKYLEMLGDREVARWYGQVSQGSRKTAKVYLRRLGYACDRYHITPRAVAKLDRRGMRDFLVDMVNDMDAKGNAGGYIESAVKAVKSWLRFNLRPVGEIRVKIPRLNETPTIADEVVPSKEELNRILAAKDIRAKVAVALVAFTSVRPEVVGSSTDGLRLKDLPELRWDEGTKKVSFGVVPALVRVRAVISKLGHEYLTFLNAQGCEFVMQYLEMRLRSGEKLTPNSALLTQKYATQVQERPKFRDTVSKRRGDLITVENVRDLIRSAIRGAGFRWRPYILRRYFDHNMLLNATARGVVSRDFVVFWMGHSGDMEHVYTLHKSLPQETIEQMRGQYAEASQRYLETGGGGSVTKDTVLNLIRTELLVRSGYGKEEVEKMGDLSALPEEEMERMIDAKWEEKLGVNGGTKVVSRDEAKALMQKGWDFVNWWDDTKTEAIMRPARAKLPARQ